MRTVSWSGHPDLNPSLNSALDIDDAKRVGIEAGTVVKISISAAEKIYEMI